MPDGKKPVTAIQVFAFVIVLLTIGAIVWAVGYSSDFLENAAKINGLIKILAAFVIVAIVFIVLFYLVSGSNTTGESQVFRRELMQSVMESVRKVTPMQWAASLIGLFTIGAMVWVLTSESNFFSTAEKARGLLTFAVTIVTVAIALILVFFLVFAAFGADDKEKKEEFTARFTLGKDILMVFVGILGTVMGFYYGEGNLSKDQIKSIADVVQKPPASQDLEQKALDLLLKKDFDGAIKAFDDAFSATPALANIGNIAAIRKILTDNKVAFKDATDAAKQKAWQTIFLEIKDKQLTVGMTDEMKKTVEGYSKPPPSPSPTSSPTSSPSPSPTATATP